MNRRRFITGLGGILAAGVAPAFVHSIMPIRGDMIILPGDVKYFDVEIRIELADPRSAISGLIESLRRIDARFGVDEGTSSMIAHDRLRHCAAAIERGDLTPPVIEQMHQAVLLAAERTWLPLSADPRFL